MTNSAGQKHLSPPLATTASSTEALDLCSVPHMPWRGCGAILLFLLFLNLPGACMEPSGDEALILLRSPRWDWGTSSWLSAITQVH